jgi:TraX protein
MSLFVIKMIALSSMFFDHLGAFLFPGNIYFRLIGRLSFPLFAWAIANGAHFTKNINKYLIRILVLAFISQIPYQLLFKTYGVDKPGLNIIFTLALGIFSIILLKKFNKILMRALIILLLPLFALLVHADYGAFGVLTIIIFYLYYDNQIKYSFFYTLLVAVFYLLPNIVNKYFSGTFDISNIYFLEIFSALSLIIIAGYNRKKGYDLKYLFYIFYPVHLLVIYLIAVYFL